jgi:hypothetical protein
VDDWQEVEGVGQRRLAVQAHVVFLRADLDRAGGQNQALIVDGVRDVAGGQALRIEGARVEIDRNLPRAAAVRQRKAGAFHVGELGADEVIAEVV